MHAGAQLGQGAGELLDPDVEIRYTANGERFFERARSEMNRVYRLVQNFGAKFSSLTGSAGSGAHTSTAGHAVEASAAMTVASA